MATIFERELKSFKAHLTPGEQSSFNGTTLEDVRLTVASIQKTQITERTNKNVARLRKFLEAVESYSKVLDVFVNINDFVAFVWGPIKYLLLVASTYTDAFTTLLDTYQSISRQLPLLAQYQDLFARHGGMEEVLVCMFKNIFDFHLRALGFFRAGKWKQIFKAHVFRTQFDDIVGDLRQHREMVERQADLIEFQEAKQARDEAQQHYEEHREQEQLRRKFFMQDWLDAPNVAGQQEKGQLTREARPQSGQWLLSRDKVKAWLDPAMSVAACLWIHGIPGAGKTVLASLLIDSCKSVANARTVYFYCRHGDPRADNFISMARSFLDQLSHMESSIVDMLYDMATKKENCFKTRKETEELLQVCLDAAGTLYIVVDGLDECNEPEQKAIARWLRKYADNSGATRDPTRCAFLSQDDTTTRALLSTLSTVRITASDNKDDIKDYCSAIAKKIQVKFDESDAGTSYIAEAVSTKADGMFLYAILVMDNLLHQLDLAAMRAELDPRVFPTGLHQAYGRILKRIFDETRPAQCQGARKILAWLVCAIRPLRWREIQCAISTDADAGMVDPDRRLIVGPKELCGSLVEQQRDDSLRLVHTTAKLYLIAADVIHEPLEHLQLSKLSLYQFCFSIFDDNLTADQMISHVRAGDFALFDYSIVNWIPHFLASMDVNSGGNLSMLSQSDFTEFVEILCIFLDVHWKTPKKKSRTPKSMVNAAKRLPGLEEAERIRLLRTLASANGLVTSELQDSTCFEASKLYSTLRKVRLTIENLAAEPSARNDIERFYGTTVFKCPRLYCRWFYEGFGSAAKRDEHVAKHERAYYCPYIGCTHATLGCKTESELENHFQTYHKPSLTDEDFLLPPKPPTSIPPQPSPPPPPPASPPLPHPQSPPAPQTAASPKNNTPSPPATQHPAPSSPIANKTPGSTSINKRPSTFDPAPYQQPAKRIRQVGPFKCEMCDKVFARIALFNSHKMVHSNEKPFSCAKCNKAFARQPDLTRHEKLHSGDRKFTCHGTLLDGRDWGCRKKFARADGLARHFKGIAGALCLKPMRDEDERHKQQLTSASSATFTIGGAISPAPGQAYTMSNTQLGTTTPGWGYLPLPDPRFLQNTHAEIFGYDDTFPMALYEQHPEVAGFNWDAVLPE